MTTNLRSVAVSALVLLGLVAAACSSSSTPSTIEPTVSVPPLSAPTTEAEPAEASPDATDAPIVPAVPDNLQADFDDLVANAPGGAVAAVRVGDGPIVTLASGTEPDGTPLDPDAVVRVGSISKVVTSVLVLSLVDEGLLDLDARLGDILPETPVGGDATIRQLLAHRTGIANYTDDPQFFQSVLRRPNRFVEPEDVLGFAEGDALFAPGEAFAYSNTNYVLLGQVLESVTGEDLNTLVQTRIAEPLGLAATSFDLGDRTDVVAGFTGAVSSGDTGTADYTSVASSAWAAGSLVTTVDDLSRFITALLDGELLGADRLADMRGPIDDGEDYGLGLHPGPDFGVGHGGAILGFTSIMQHDPATGDLMIVVVNNDMRSAEALTGGLWEAAAAT